MCARLTGKQRREPRLQGGPLRPVVLCSGIDIRQAEFVQQQGVKLRLNGTQRDEAPFSTGVDVVIRRIMEEVEVGAIEPATGPCQLRNAAQHGDDIDDGCVHYTAPAADTHLKQCAGNAESQTQCTARITHHRGRHHRAFTPVRRQRQQTRECHIVQVVPGSLCQGPALAPARHAAINQLWVVRHAIGWAQTQALHHAGAVAFNQRIGSSHQRHRLGDICRFFQIEYDHRLPVAQWVAGRCATCAAQNIRAGPGDDAYRRAHIGQHAASQRARANTFKLDDANACQGEIHTVNSS